MIPSCGSWGTERPRPRPIHSHTHKYTLAMETHTQATHTQSHRHIKTKDNSLNQANMMPPDAWVSGRSPTCIWSCDHMDAHVCECECMWCDSSALKLRGLSLRGTIGKWLPSLNSPSKPWMYKLSINLRGRQQSKGGPTHQQPPPLPQGPMCVLLCNEKYKRKKEGKKGCRENKPGYKTHCPQLPQIIHATCWILIEVASTMELIKKLF